MSIISVMTVLELSTALAVVFAGLAGLIKSSNCKKIECSCRRGCICEKDIEIQDESIEENNNKILKEKK